MSSSRRKILSLYRNILRESKKFTSYNFRSYALQRTKDAFKENKSESSPEKIQALIKKAEDNLDMIKRQDQAVDDSNSQVASLPVSETKAKDVEEVTI